MIRRYYGGAAGRRFAVGMGGALALQQALVGLAVLSGRVEGYRRLNLVDLMTLSRGVAAAALGGLAVSGVRDRRGPAGWLGWLALLYGAILCDWLDGPVARHRGTTELGRLFDLEADSWLTLCAAAAAAAWGGLSGVVAAAPLLRYALLADGLRQAPYADLHTNEPGWVRQLGIAQMLLFIAALAPFGGRATRLVVRLAAPIQTPLQVCGLLLHQRRRRAR
jgi:phosphatidylglycerophosphate synthase